MSDRKRALAAGQIPNALSVLRLGIAIAFPFLAPGWWRLPIVLIGTLTDLADGIIARRLGVTSWVGGLLDAVADKALTLSVLVTLTIEHRLAWWHLALILSRDLAVLGIAGLAASARAWGAFTRMPSRWAGKTATALIFVTMLAALSVPGVVGWLAPIAGLASVVAAGDYLACARARFHDERRTSTADTG